MDGLIDNLIEPLMKNEQAQKCYLKILNNDKSGEAKKVTFKTLLENNIKTINLKDYHYLKSLS